MSFLRISVDGGNPLELMIAKATNIRPALEQWLEMRRELVEEEFEKAAWRPPSGPMRPWRDVGAFGRRPAPSSPLHRTGALLRALLGKGTGSIERITDTSAEFGVSATRFPHAAVHRGGTGAVLAADARVPERIGVTPKMRRYLAGALGVFLRRETRFIEIPRRPFATDNPEAETRRAAIFVAHVRGEALGATRA